MIDFIKKLFYQKGKVKDLVCGMMVDPKTAAYKTTYQNKQYFFCSEHCKNQFDKSPQEYVQ
ncbi:YHS domain-containing protein [Candidatus Roizmanbacteria bacterium]|nr:YHS domain-containing protein [Candidatus Roizmanbacteria bacterium]